MIVKDLSQSESRALLREIFDTKGMVTSTPILKTTRIKPPAKKAVKAACKRNPIETTEEPSYTICDDIVFFALRGRAEKEGVQAIVSLNKWSQVQRYNWYLGKSGYPVCYELGMLQLHRFVFMHSIGSRLPPDMCIDHIDRNKLNNTDQNLRLATPQENSYNRSSSTNLKGVRRISKNNYSAVITHNGIKREIKNIPTEQRAAEIYNMMAQELFGEFAALNEIQKPKDGTK